VRVNQTKEELAHVPSKLRSRETMPEHRIQRISVTRDGERVRAEAIVLLDGETKTLTAEETPQPGESLAVTEGRAIAALRKTLYATGLSKRAIATAVNEWKRD
jgi:hypothetical protein